jgi:hypothetical protein
MTPSLPLEIVGYIIQAIEFTSRVLGRRREMSSYVYHEHELAKIQEGSQMQGLVNCIRVWSAMRRDHASLVTSQFLGPGISNETESELQS